MPNTACYQYAQVHAWLMSEKNFELGGEGDCQYWHDGVAFNFTAIGASNDADCVGELDWETQNVSWADTIDDYEDLLVKIARDRLRNPVDNEGKRIASSPPITETSFITQWIATVMPGCYPEYEWDASFELVGEFKLPSKVEVLKNGAS